MQTGLGDLVPISEMVRRGYVGRLNTLYYAAERGQLPVVRVGRAVLVRQTDVEWWAAWRRRLLKTGAKPLAAAGEAR
jgi:hypothetical protein